MQRIEIIEKAFNDLLNEVATPSTLDSITYPRFLSHTYEKKGRYPNIFSKHDQQFPNYNANVVMHGETCHILLEGPAAHDKAHCKRFEEVITGNAIKVQAVIAAGDPLEDRSKGKGYHIYFNAEPVDKAGRILDCKFQDIDVYYIPEFKDFSTLSFTPHEVAKLLKIHLNTKCLAIHCSAGMGRTGVLELAYCLFDEYEKCYPDGVPDFAAIQKKLEELREFRPATIQTSMQYRMAIILGKQLRLANECALSDEVCLKMIDDVDDASILAAQTLRAAIELQEREARQQVVSLAATNSSLFHSGEHNLLARSGEYQNFISDDEDSLRNSH